MMDSKISYLAGFDHFLLPDPYPPAPSHMSIYDNMRPGSQWSMTSQGPKLVPFNQARFVLEFQKLRPQQFRKKVTSFLIHMAHLSKVSEVPAHSMLGLLKMTLPKMPKGLSRLHGTLLNIDTWADLMKVYKKSEGKNGKPSRKWYRFFERLEEVEHVIFNDAVPKGLVLGLSQPEYVGKLAYRPQEADTSFHVGVWAFKQGVRAVRIKGSSNA